MLPREQPSTHQKMIGSKYPAKRTEARRHRAPTRAQTPPARAAVWFFTAERIIGTTIPRPTAPPQKSIASEPDQRAFAPAFAPGVPKKAAWTKAKSTNASPM